MSLPPRRSPLSHNALLYELSRLEQARPHVTWSLRPARESEPPLTETTPWEEQAAHFVRQLAREAVIGDPAQGATERPFFPLFWLSDLLSNDPARAALAAVSTMAAGEPVLHELGIFAELAVSPSLPEWLLRNPPAEVQSLQFLARARYQQMRREGTRDHPTLRAFLAIDEAIEACFPGDDHEADRPEDLWLRPFQDMQTAAVTGNVMDENQFGWSFLTHFQQLLTANEERSHDA